MFTESCTPRITPWFRPHPTATAVCSKKSAIILGAGLAGCYLARELANRGWNIQLIEAAAQIASGASAYEHALLFPGFHRAASPLENLLSRGYAYSQTCLTLWETQAQAVERCGLLYFPRNHHLDASDHPHRILVDRLQASELAGVPILAASWYFSGAASVHLPRLCRWLTMHPKIKIVLNQCIESIDFQGEWRVGSQTSPVLILANGIYAKQFIQTNYIPLQPIRGQMTWIEATASSRQVKIPLCSQIQVLPMQQGAHAVGATYDRGETDAILRSSDSRQNLLKLNQLQTEVAWGSQIIKEWAGIRTMSGDYFPCVGAVAKEEAFMQQYASLKTDLKRWVPTAAESYSGLYLFSGFGSKGLTTIPLLANALAEEMNNGFLTLTPDELRRLSPNRFLLRKLARTR